MGNCPFGPHGHFAHVPHIGQIHRYNNGPMGNYRFQPVGPVMGCPFSDLWTEECCRSQIALFQLTISRLDKVNFMNFTNVYQLSHLRKQFSVILTT